MMNVQSLFTSLKVRPTLEYKHEDVYDILPEDYKNRILYLCIKYELEEYFKRRIQKNILKYESNGILISYKYPWNGLFYNDVIKSYHIIESLKSGNETPFWEHELKILEDYITRKNPVLGLKYMESYDIEKMINSYQRISNSYYLSEFLPLTAWVPFSVYKQNMISVILKHW